MLVSTHPQKSLVLSNFAYISFWPFSHNQAFSKSQKRTCLSFFSFFFLKDNMINVLHSTFPHDILLWRRVFEPYMKFTLQYILLGLTSYCMDALQFFFFFGQYRGDLATQKDQFEGDRITFKGLEWCGHLF
jgi:hypothetical protein